MLHVFEHFVRNFFQLEQKEFAVCRKTFGWEAETATPGDLDYLPKMNTDVVLSRDSPKRAIILDAKFYPEALMGSREKKMYSNNLYQVMAYLFNFPDRAHIF